MTDKINKVVLAYSGGLDTSIIVRWLIETYGCEVICFAADLGQGDELAPLEEKALKTGASKIYIDNLQEEFIKDYVFPMFRANTIYEGTYLLGTAIARPIIAKRQIEIAAQEGAHAVSHGATGKGNDQVRFEMSYYALNPNIKVIAPWREWDLISRDKLLGYAEKYDISTTVTKSKPYSCDRNLLHLSFEGGVLEDPWTEPPADIYELTKSPDEAPDKPTYIEIDFEKGDPTHIDGQPMTPATLLTYLNKVGGENGIGRVDLVENRFVGMKSRGVYETPGGTILLEAHRAMESITMDRDVMHIRDSLVPKYAQIIYNGFWFTPERELMQKLIDESQVRVNGTVRLRLYKGNVMVVGRKSPDSLYNPEFATFDEDSVYNHAEAEGFIKLNALRMRIRELMRNP